jgi:acetyl-CoA carboxylase biotin carboxyl carrier protein
MDIRKIKKLIDLIEASNINEIEIKEGEESVRLSRLPSSSALSAAMSAPASVINIPAQTQPSEAAEHGMMDSDKVAVSNASGSASGHKVKSPMVGTFYSSASPDAPPFVKVGQKVSMGDALCLVEAMKMFNEIEADKAGTIKEILVGNGDVVEFDQPLFIIE